MGLESSQRVICTKLTHNNIMFPAKSIQKYNLIYLVVSEALHGIIGLGTYNSHCNTPEHQVCTYVQMHNIYTCIHVCYL